MSRKFKALWLELKQPLPADLEARVIGHLRAAERRFYTLRLIGWSGLTISSLAALIPALNYLTTAVSTSGFYQYLSLALTDQSVFISYWRELALSLTESLPIMAVTAVLSLLAVLLWTIPKNISLIYDYSKTV